jgi:hypothetical protein
MKRNIVKTFALWGASRLSPLARPWRSRGRDKDDKAIARG